MVTVLAISMLVAPASAQNPVPIFAGGNIEYERISPNLISPFWSETSMAVARISASNRTITSTAQVVAHHSTTRISGTMFLEENRNGTWRSVASWSISGTGVLTANRTFTGTSGVTYRTRIVVTVGSERIERVSGAVRA